jgi:hypothetical protein
VAVLQEFKKQIEEKEKRAWTLWVAMLGCFLTLLANLLLLVLRR